MEDSKSGGAPPEVTSGGAAPPGARTPRTDYERNLKGVYGGRPEARGYDSGDPNMPEEVFREGKPTDTQIRKDVARGLVESARIDPARIDIRVERGDVTLRGIVDDRELKAVAEDVTRNIPGVERVHNEISVRYTMGPVR